MSGHWANADQQDYMRELDAIPVKELCWCGWYRADDPVHRKHALYRECREGRTAAEKLGIDDPALYELGGEG